MRWDLSAEFGDISKEQFAEFHDAFCTYWSTALAARTWCCWIAEREGHVVTTIFVQVIGMVPRPGELRRHYGYVASVYTRPEARSQGIGSQVMQRAIQWAADEELGFLILWPRVESIEFYRRLGFVPSGEAFELGLR